MALSNFLIRPPSETPQAQTGTPRRPVAAQTAAPSAFAALMSGQNANTENAGSAGPRHSVMPLAAGQRNLVLAGRTPSDLMRAHAFNKAEADLRRSKAMEGLMQSLAGNGSTLDLARSMGAARHLGAITGAFDNRLRGLNAGDFVHSRANAGRANPPAPRTKPSHKVEDMGLGQLSARFESGSDGVAAVGYDRNGGTSYGKYQVSSRAGSLGDFLKFLDTEAPDISKRLRASGPGNTGSRKGAMPDTWRAIASEQPERFEQLQEAFVHQSHYKPALESIMQRTGLTEGMLSTAMREVIWSTAVQHGPAGAARIFARADAMSGKPTDPAYERNLISNVYKIRVTQFGSSTSSVQAAVANRFRQEKAIALNMLDGARTSTLA
ncbi:MAG: chitosanase [Desulfovibrio desulfuricans]|nr:chitosanase [Desulfovibrio desulfuricans]